MSPRVFPASPGAGPGRENEACVGQEQLWNALSSIGHPRTVGQQWVREEVNERRRDGVEKGGGTKSPGGGRFLPDLEKSWLLILWCCPPVLAGEMGSLE